MLEKLPDAIFLIGAKGSGKTFIGKLLETTLGIPFLRVEQIWLAIKQAGVSSEADYLERGMDAVILAAQELAQRSRAFSLESTGAFDDMDAFLDRFRPFSNPRLVQVRASADASLQRVHTRDQSEHINVSDARVEEVNRRALAVQLPFELIIQNDPFADPAWIVSSIRQMLHWEAGPKNQSG